MSLLIGRHIYNTLNGNAAVSAIVGSKIFPIIRPEGVASLPYIEFECSTTGPDYSKDGMEGDNHQVTIRCVAKSYDKVIELADDVRNALDSNLANYTDWEITRAELMQCDDAYFEDLDAWAELMTFSFTSESTED